MSPKISVSMITLIDVHMIKLFDGTGCSNAVDSFNRPAVVVLMRA